VLQFATAFGVWIVADRLGLSAIVTVVVFAVTVARQSPSLTPARMRIPSYAVWDTAVFVLNVLAFVLIGLQVRPILSALDPGQRITYFEVAGAVLLAVVVIRIAWAFLYNSVARAKYRYVGGGRWPGPTAPSIRSSIVVSWCGMRGIVTLAAAYALPVTAAGVTGFPYRDLILLCAFVVVVGTLVVQGFTLRPLILALHLKDDRQVDHEVRLANQRLTRVALTVLDGDQAAESQELRREFAALLDDQSSAEAPSRYDLLRARIINEQRRTLVAMRDQDDIGDDAFHQVEARLDLAELNVQSGQSSD
jgi:NhaP-type Na+/H+ or K+/H+ antiporter